MYLNARPLAGVSQRLYPTQISALCDQTLQGILQKSAATLDLLPEPGAVPALGLSACPSGSYFFPFWNSAVGSIIILVLSKKQK